MTFENAQRTAESAAAIQTRLHLVYSRDWSSDRRRRAVIQHVIEPSQGQLGHTVRRAGTRYLAAAALAAPLFWAGHALLQHLHIL